MLAPAVGKPKALRRTQGKDISKEAAARLFTVFVLSRRHF